MEKERPTRSPGRVPGSVSPFHLGVQTKDGGRPTWESLHERMDADARVQTSTTMVEGLWKIRIMQGDRSDPSHRGEDRSDPGTRGNRSRWRCGTVAHGRTEEDARPEDHGEGGRSKGRGKTDRGRSDRIDVPSRRITTGAGDGERSPNASCPRPNPVSGPTNPCVQPPRCRTASRGPEGRLFSLGFPSPRWSLCPG